MTWLRTWMIWAVLVVSALSVAGLQTLRLSNLKTDYSNTLRMHAEAMEAAEAKARMTETILRTDMDEISARLAKENEDARLREDALVESVRAGSRRLSIAASCPASQGGDSTSASHGWTAPQRAELAPEVGVALIGIARDGDSAIRERNSCIEAYEAVRLRFNGIQ